MSACKSQAGQKKREKNFSWAKQQPEEKSIRVSWSSLDSFFFLLLRLRLLLLHCWHLSRRSPKSSSIQLRGASVRLDLFPQQPTSTPNLSFPLSVLGGSFHQQGMSRFDPTSTHCALLLRVLSSSFTILTALKSNFSLYTTKGVRENGLIDSLGSKSKFSSRNSPILHGYMDEYLTRERNKDSLLLGAIHPRGILILPLPPLHMFGCVCVCVCGSLLFSFHLQVRAKGSSSQGKDRPGDLALPVQSTSVRRLS